jgi:(E)-4-hydroxy-3-methylbut-2-enyl-diphosphate synthase
MNYCTNPYHFSRRLSRELVVGNVRMGAHHPVVVQSMITADTMDTSACVQQTLDLVAVGSQIVRITAPTVKDAANLKAIREELDRRGCHVPIVADIHFKPEAAIEAARWIEAVRINPGNYADKKKFAVHEYTDVEYQEELERIEEAFTPLVRLCLERGVAMRIGTNHGSLSDRIMNRFGDTPRGMVESAFEFARIARKLNYHNFNFSMKASNPKVMIEAYRLLVALLDEQGPDWNYPIHTGVTEAGEGEDGRIKSAIGIGALLMDGIGDTIRVSLTEDSPHEIPVCRALIAQIPHLTSSRQDFSGFQLAEARDPFHFERRLSDQLLLPSGVAVGHSELVRVAVTRQTWEALMPNIRPNADVRPELILEDLECVELDPSEPFPVPAADKMVTVRDGVGIAPVAAFRMLSARLHHLGAKNPILLKDTLESPISGSTVDSDAALLGSSAVLGALLCDGIGDAILVRRETAPGAALKLAFNILQATGCRSFKTDYVACPSCGRTLFNLQEVTARIKARTDHLKGVKIAIMGCIVNGPGEMADADFGYVGGAPAKINLYVGKTAVRFNIPEEEAVDRLVDLIREHGKWVEPPQ